MKLDNKEPAQTPTHHKSLQDSFIRSVGRSVRSHKLGDLLVAARLISREQLRAALKVQKDSGERLGKVLVDQGYISGVQLYRKLAEQWCIKASAAGVALLVQMAGPGAARADDAGSQVRLAAAFTPGVVRTVHNPAYPHLFGSTEIKNTNLAAFTKWTSAMARFDDQMKANAGTPVVQSWKARLHDLRGRSAREQIEGVNDFINSVRYIEDSQNYRKSDYWATPVEFMTRGGDCEDFAIAKYASLRALGFSADQMRIAVVHDKVKKIHHAILVVYTEGGTFVLDNQNKKVAKADNVDRYKPIFSLNSNSWWLHRAPKVS